MDGSRRLAVAAVLAGGLALGALGDLGEHVNREVASANGWTLTIECPAVTHPGLVGHLRIALEAPAQFGGPVTLALDGAYWDQFDVSFEPPPLEIAAEGDTVQLMYSIPLGEILLVDASTRLVSDADAIEGRVAAVVNDDEVVSLDCRTAVLP